MDDKQKSHLIERIERSIHYMISSLNEETSPSLEEIAGAAAISKFHFHRVYRLVTGETCTETLRRLRLAQGATHLLRPNATITDAAFEAGYATSQAFAKALKTALSVSASDLKADPEKLSNAIGYLGTPAAPMAAEPSPLLSVEVASLEPFDIIVKRHVGDPATENSVYEALFEAIGDFENLRAILGFPYDDPRFEKIDDCVVDCAIGTLKAPDSIPTGMTLKDSPSGLFLSTNYTGSYDEMGPITDALYSAALSMRFIELDDTPMFIHYQDDPEEIAEEALRATVYLPFKMKENHEV
ncbi:MAG: hypothetical protein COB37_00030 [Kordiimonadales bacterium]|nr:MAG: hypothetical protein COB37_00030 [Kordiimonadales bacterium]